MDKNAIKKYAVWARKELISRVAQKAQQYGITETEMVDAGADSVNGKVLSAEEMQQRRALIAQINEKGYQQVMEEVAYTWFNRFSALRFMEVNGYLPSHVRVFTDENNAFKPQILAEALHLELGGRTISRNTIRSATFRRVRGTMQRSPPWQSSRSSPAIRMARSSLTHRSPERSLPRLLPASMRSRPERRPPSGISTGIGRNGIFPARRSWAGSGVIRIIRSARIRASPAPRRWRSSTVC